MAGTIVAALFWLVFLGGIGCVWHQDAQTRRDAASMREWERAREAMR